MSTALLKVHLDEVELLATIPPADFEPGRLDEAALAPLKALGPGDKVDMVLDDDRVVRTYVTHPALDIAGDGTAWSIWLKGVRNSVPLERVRPRGGWGHRP